jgi:hypothetical protein
MSRRKIRQKKKPAEPEGMSYQTFRFTPDGLEITDCEVPAEDVESLHLYIGAHDLMPQLYVFDGGPESMAEVEEASVTLALELVDEAETARAIAILGHSPCQQAIVALTRATDLPYPFGRMAHHALAECISIGQSPPPGFKGVFGSWPGA